MHGADTPPCAKLLGVDEEWGGKLLMIISREKRTQCGSGADGHTDAATQNHVILNSVPLSQLIALAWSNTHTIMSKCTSCGFFFFF